MPDSFFPDYDAFTVERLRLPIKGKEYVIPEVGAQDAIILRLAAEGNEDALAKVATEGAIYRMVLGGVWADLIADNAPDGAIGRAALAALADFRHGRIAAMQAWRTGRDPEAQAAILAATKAILAAA